METGEKAMEAKAAGEAMTKVTETDEPTED